MSNATTERTVPLGRIVMTAGVLENLTAQDVIDCLQRHAACDWGDVDEEDWQTNCDALNEDHRLLSAYRGRSGRKFWIITQHDRLLTTILLPEEY